MLARLMFAVIVVFTLCPCGFAAEAPPTIKIGDEELVLNGSGAREKYFMEMYVAGLYLKEREKEAATIIEADAPMAIRIEITSRMVSQEKLVESLNEGFVNSTKGKLESLREEIEEFRKAFAGEIERGDVFELVYAPEQGVKVLKNSKETGAIKGLQFKQALFGIWLGDKPADKALKAALLGRE